MEDLIHNDYNYASIVLNVAQVRELINELQNMIV